IHVNTRHERRAPPLSPGERDLRKGLPPDPSTRRPPVPPHPAGKASQKSKGKRQEGGGGPAQRMAHGRMRRGGGACDTFVLDRRYNTVVRAFPAPGGNDRNASGLSAAA